MSRRRKYEKAIKKEVKRNLPKIVPMIIGKHGLLGPIEYETFIYNYAIKISIK